MKSLLLFSITITLLVIPSNLLSSEKLTVYRWETSKGIKWKKFGEEGVNEKYVGEVNWLNIPEGLGTLNYLNGDKYIGEFQKGKREGLGTYIWSNHQFQEKYVGEFTNDNFGKVGKIFYENGQKYSGEVFERNGSLSYLKGIKTLPNGRRYEGVWNRTEEDKIYWNIIGIEKDGSIILEISEGFGTGEYIGSKGSIFKGEWREGVRYKGSVEFKDNFFEGKWENESFMEMEIFSTMKVNTLVKLKNIVVQG